MSSCNICLECSHELDGRKCSYCAGIKLCENEICTMCFDNSFAVCKKAKFWSNVKNKLRPRQVFKWDRSSYWFKCDKCFIEYSTILRDDVDMEWCPECEKVDVCAVM